MKTYYVRRGNFANVFDLAWADNADDVAWLLKNGFERCTRREAENNARWERDRRKYNPAFSGYGDILIYPAKYYRLPEYDADTWLYRHCEKKGLIME